MVRYPFPVTSHFLQKQRLSRWRHGYLQGTHSFAHLYEYARTSNDHPANANTGTGNKPQLWSHRDNSSKQSHQALQGCNIEETLTHPKTSPLEVQ